MNHGAGNTASCSDIADNDGGESAAKLKEGFVEYKNGIRYVSLRAACWLVIALMPAGVALDWFVYPEQLGFFAILRFICSVFTLAVWEYLATPHGRRHHRACGMGLFLLPNLFMCLMIYFTEGAHSPYYAGLNVMVMGFSWVAQVNFIEGLIGSLLTLLMYCVACIAHGNGSSADYFSNIYFIVLTAITANTGGYLLDRLRFREFALRLQLDGNREELQQSNAKLVELDRAKSTFFANVSHELRTPLTLLIGPLERLRHQNPPPPSHEQVEMLDIMYNNAMRLLRLINDLLDLVRLDSGTIRLRREKMELIPFLEGIAKSVTPMAEQRQLYFETHFEVQKDAFVRIDQDKLEKIILNLLFNSFKFTPENGTVILGATLRDTWLIITVRDTGKGIAENDLPRIFDRFWQAETAATRRYQGVGIGLALVKELAEAHGGSVSVESKVDKGTTFRVTVDVGDHEETDEAPEANSPEPPSYQPEWLSQLYRRAELFPSHIVGVNETKVSQEDTNEDKPLVLVADDEPEMRRFLSSQLKSVYTIQEARNGSEALKLARTHNFTLILLDLMMPGIDGITLTCQLREEPHTETVPIIILTARADEGSKMQALKAGVTDFLTKPFSTSELIVRCHNLLFQNQLQQNLSRKTRELEAALEQIKSTETKMVHQAKMASLGQLSSGLMHEINNPLNFANTASFLLQKRLQKIPLEHREPLMAPLTDLQDGIRRVADIITSLRSFLHPDTSNFSQIGLREVVGTSIRFVQIPPSEIDLDVNIPDDLKVWGNQNQLIHLFINLLQNAVDSLREKGAQKKNIKIEASLQNGRILLTCEDNGKGIKLADKDKVFDAFFTTKPVGSGMGLGLNIGYRIVQNHLGELNVESQENEFCRFIITLNQTKPTS